MRRKSYYTNFLRGQFFSLQDPFGQREISLLNTQCYGTESPLILSLIKIVSYGPLQCFQRPDRG